MALSNLLNTALVLSVLFVSPLSFAANDGETMTAVTEADRSAGRFGVKLNPLTLLFGRLTMGTDLSLSDKWRIDLDGHYMPLQEPWWRFNPFAKYKTSGYGVSLGTTYMPLGTLSDRGIFVSGSAGYEYAYVEAEYSPLFSDDTHTSSASLGSIVADLSAGYQWLWSSFRLALGAGYVHVFMNEKAKIKVDDGETETVDAGDAFGGAMLDIHLGFVF